MSTNSCTTEKVNWHQFDSLASRGSRAPKATTLGELHAKRSETLSQYFTPSWVVDTVWSLISPALLSNKRYRLLDNSIGSASMFRHALPERHTLHGIDIDHSLIDKINEQLEGAGFTLDIQASGMENATFGEYSVALINPPFSHSLSSPNLIPFPGITHYGKHGPNTSALSHEYALAQALRHADIVCAILPRTTTKRLVDGQFGSLHSRLVAVYELPANSFEKENVASVSTDLLIFQATDNQGKWYQGGCILPGEAYALPNEVDLYCRDESQLRLKPIRIVGVSDTGPVVTTAITNDSRVVMNRAGRQITLRFFDAATEVRVKNALYRKKLVSTHFHRYPRDSKFAGQYQLSLDAIVLQPDPLNALNHVASVIKAAGGKPEITAQLRNGLKKLVKQHQQMSVPYGRTVYRKGTPSFLATAKRLAMIDKKDRRSVIALGEEADAVRTANGFTVTTSKGAFDIEHDAFFNLFHMSAEAAQKDYWEEIHPPIKALFPQRITQLEERARSLGIDKWLSWGFQLDDLCELAFRPMGGICGWQMALGKTRLMFALALLQPGASLIIVKSRLVDELIRELTSLNVAPDVYQHIARPSDISKVAKINFVSYESLRRPLNPRWPKLTLARLLKNRFKNVYADEGSVLSNPFSLQSRAVWSLGGKRRYPLDGTPMANYPRDILPLACWAVGSERSYQPYSCDRGYMDAVLFASASQQVTGRQAFNSHFVSMIWSTNEFLDTGKGAKREVPKIRSAGLHAFRGWISPLVKRRVQQEPAVSRYVSFPVPILNEPTIVDWDLEHLVVYTKTVEEFADWYRNYKASQQEDKKALNLTVILQRLEACFKAANVPHALDGVHAPYTKETNKEAFCVRMVENYVTRGRRPIVFARNPSVLKRLQTALAKKGISSLVFTGKETIKARLKRLNEDIRQGSTQVLLASLGVSQDGLNLPELNTFLFYNRSFKSREEFQGIFRLIRASQKSDVYGDFLHYAGSIDEYMGQLIQWKTLASESGLDFGESIDDNEEFVHFDAILMKFMDSLPSLKAKITKLRHQHKAA